MSDQPRTRPDQTAVLVAYAALWSRERAASDAMCPPLSEDARATALQAARYAETSFSGPVGELMAQEIRAYVEGGHALPWRHIAPRLVSEMRQRESRFPTNHTHGNKVNPVTLRYIPGSNLRCIGPDSRPSIP
ncbi:MAG: hypothetical protein QOE59_3727 [Actinomycetota bacterium]|jgi:hypothetical protein|nr:hypothetical protein [Actinomycetota bacterium]